MLFIPEGLFIKLLIQSNQDRAVDDIGAVNDINGVANVDDGNRPDYGFVL
ncbi:MAG: hypothetical protein GY928_23730 [Colwellia sp.]|nr:hypothetical protein [Colwellia sp.]